MISITFNQMPISVNHAYYFKRFGKRTVKIKTKECKEYVETSNSNSVKVKEAKILFLSLDAGKDVNGFKLNGFTVISYKDDILTIGCTPIRKDVIYNFAESMEWI